VGRERSVSIRRLAVSLLGLAVLAFGAGAGAEAAGLGRAAAVVAGVVLVLVFVLALLGGHVAAPARPPRTGRPLVAERPREAYVLGICGSAALALTLGGMVFLAVPGEFTAVTVLLVGVIAWTTVVMVSFRLQSRRWR
jgi:hypothetical protein